MREENTLKVVVIDGQSGRIGRLLVEKIREEKRKAKERKRKREALESAARQAERDARILESYIEKYRQEKARNISK